MLAGDYAIVGWLLILLVAAATVGVLGYIILQDRFSLPRDARGRFRPWTWLEHVLAYLKR